VQEEGRGGGKFLIDPAGNKESTFAWDLKNAMKNEVEAVIYQI
jgi:hypothetical protein